MSQLQQKSEKESPFDLVKVAAGAVGAMASAVLLSTLGAAGTITGAALGSVIVTVAGSMFSKGVDVSKQGVSAAQVLAARRVGQAKSQVGAASQDMDDSPQARQRLSAANAELDAAEAQLHAEQTPGHSAGQTVGPAAGQTPGPSGPDRRAVPWRRIGLGAAAVFLMAMVVITGFELVSGRAVSAMTGGSSSDQERTSLTGLTDRDKPTPSPTQTPTETPTGTPSPSDSASVEESPSAEPTETSSAEPTETPSESVTPSQDTSSTPTEEPTVSDTAVPEETTSSTP